MQAVAHLVAAAGEADVFQRPPAQMGIDPKRKNSLIRFAKLARAREHAAAIDPDGKMKRLRVFERDDFARELAGTVK